MVATGQTASFRIQDIHPSHYDTFAQLMTRMKELMFGLIPGFNILTINAVVSSS